MAKARELRRRIKSVENTRQITKTMEMVATSRLKRAQDRVVAARPYAESLADVIGSLYDPGLAERFRLLRQPEPGPHRVALLFITSNRGLCGGFNANLIRRTAGRLVELEAERRDVELHAIGRKGILVRGVSGGLHKPMHGPFGVPGGDDGLHPFQCFGTGGVNVQDSGMGMGASQYAPHQHLRQFDVHGKPSPTCGLCRSVFPGNALTHIIRFFHDLICCCHRKIL